MHGSIERARTIQNIHRDIHPHKPVLLAVEIRDAFSFGDWLCVRQPEYHANKNIMKNHDNDLTL
jgi:hypothetical protein